ncbi:DNA-processing protein DprA [Agromyces mangrovi Wang et al. 2018]|uniref:DNA-processing protein DprA n=1 Tax=Agromyces mangrovi TaxID=1858653 RepID=UPI002573F46A|nr:DNA-processing protein DprA [Agromyces mangrovi]BDZ63210.1 DNA processing protein DprA [Agromyces mangrovi]
MSRAGDLVAAAGRMPIVRGSVDDPAAVLAVAMLMHLAEPGDGTAGALAAALGPRRIVESLLAGESADALAYAAAHAGVELEPALVARGLGRWLPRLDLTAATRSVAQAARSGARLVLPGDHDWPSGLDDLGPHAPPGLWVRGAPHALDALGRSIALVGARAATGYGEHVTTQAAAGLADRGFAIVSGAAYGIDARAHRATLASDGTTVAFLAGGVDRPYPAAHDSLLADIAARGAVVSEVPCGAAPTKWRFLQRNRLIAAAANATIVLEAGRRSGSLNTAGHAATLGRPLGAVPGPVTSPASAGCHRLLREYDAVCVTDASEMAELAGDTPPGSSAQPLLGELAPDELRALDALAPRAACSVDDIARRAGLEPTRARAALAGLEALGAAATRDALWVRTRTMPT